MLQNNPRIYSIYLNVNSENKFLFILYQFFILVFFKNNISSSSFFVLINLGAFLLQLDFIWLWFIDVRILQSVVYDLKCCNLLYLCITFIKIIWLKQYSGHLFDVYLRFIKFWDIKYVCAINALEILPTYKWNYKKVLFCAP